MSTPLNCATYRHASHSLKLLRAISRNKFKPEKLGNALSNFGLPMPLFSSYEPIMDGHTDRQELHCGWSGQKHNNVEKSVIRSTTCWCIASDSFVTDRQPWLRSSKFLSRWSVSVEYSAIWHEAFVSIYCTALQPAKDSHVCPQLLRMSAAVIILDY